MPRRPSRKQARRDALVVLYQREVRGERPEQLFCELREREGYCADAYTVERVMGVLAAADVGAPHRRERIWIAAHADAGFVRTPWTPEDQAGPADVHKRGAGEARRLGAWWKVEPEPCSVAYGVAGVVDELRPFGNGQVPAVVAHAWRVLTAGKSNTHNAEVRGDGPASPARRPSSNDGLGAAAPERN